MALNNSKEEYNHCIDLQNSVMNLEFKNFARINWNISKNRVLSYVL